MKPLNVELKKATKNGLLRDASLTSEKKRMPILCGSTGSFHISLFSDLLDRSMNPDVRICSCLKITLFKPQLVYVTDKDSIGYHEIKEEQTTNVF